jgi:hypothetical protein
MVELAFYAAGAAFALLLAIGLFLLVLQVLTGFPFRWGWRRHDGAIGKVLPHDDERLPKH